jgi:pyridoxal 5'-phosphate synthase pdxS subunit
MKVAMSPAGRMIFFPLMLQAVTHYNDPKVLAEVSSGLGEAMVGIDCRTSNFYSYAARSE